MLGTVICATLFYSGVTQGLPPDHPVRSFIHGFFDFTVSGENDRPESAYIPIDSDEESGAEAERRQRDRNE